jgi:DNA (cytosine-5)-methyltransferase 1
MTETTPTQILQHAHQLAQTEINSDALPAELYSALQILAENAETQKAVLGAVVTSLTYKIWRPDQDIRYHQEQMPNGYSARTFDTKYVTPFMKAYFRRYAMAESAWLTRSIEQPHPFTSAFPGHIRSTPVKQAFLQIIAAAQVGTINAKQLLVALFALLLAQAAEQSVQLFTATPMLSIAQIVALVKQHFEHRYDGSGAARLPVLALYAVYELLVQDVRRYEGKTLKPLGSHTSADKRAKAAGDLEIFREDGSLFEAVEVKYQKPITPIMLEDAYHKVRNSIPERYYLLTTHEPNILEQNRTALAKKIIELETHHACQFIVNGVLPSLKYYLRLVQHPTLWLEKYTALVATDTALKNTHRQVWDALRDALHK